MLFRFFFWLIFLGSLGLNLFVLLAMYSLGGSESRLHERHHSGARDAGDKVAVVRIDGVIMEGFTDYARKQIDQAAEDKDVKAVVVRINSPGGTITASDDLYHRIKELRDGNPAKHTPAKPVVVSMGGLAASGGYYIAVPAQRIVAERTTTTGSIGVYASFPNVTGLAKKYGFSMNIIKAGDVKDSGSMFHDMTPQERQLWQDSVDHAYNQFLAVVEEGRHQLKGKLREKIIDRTIPRRDGNGDVVHDKGGKEEVVHYVRRLADGGVFTADEAKKYKLIDDIGYLEDAITAARKAAAVGDNYEAVTYDRPQTLLGGLLGVKSAEPGMVQLDGGKLAAGVAPRMWYLAPQSDLAAILTAMGRE
jgi:protease-4